MELNLKGWVGEASKGMAQHVRYFAHFNGLPASKVLRKRGGRRGRVNKNNGEGVEVIKSEWWLCAE